VSGFEPRAHFRVAKALKLTDRKTGFAVAAAGMALAEAGFPEEAREALGVVLGTSGSDLQEKELARAFRRAPEPFEATDVPRFASAVLEGLNPLWLLVGLPNMTSAHVAIQLGARGPNSTVMTDWASGLQAIAEAADWVRAGECDAVLAGGADSGLHPLAYAALEQAGRLGGPEGLVPGEGAAVVLLEERDRALARGATIVGEIVASGAGPDLPAVRARVLAEAGWTDAQVVSIDGGELARRAGHLLGASGALQLVLGLTGGGASILTSSLGPSGTAVVLAARALGR
jgi:3-oxoacyl-[acyl-carrier-protein] synthase II